MLTIVVRRSLPLTLLSEVRSETGIAFVRLVLLRRGDVVGETDVKQ